MVPIACSTLPAGICFCLIFSGELTGGKQNLGIRGKNGQHRSNKPILIGCANTEPVITDSLIRDRHGAWWPLSDKQGKRIKYPSIQAFLA